MQAASLILWQIATGINNTNKLVEKFDARVIDTGGKFAADVVGTSVKFANGVVDTGGAP